MGRERQQRIRPGGAPARWYLVTSHRRFSQPAGDRHVAEVGQRIALCGANQQLWNFWFDRPQGPQRELAAGLCAECARLLALQPGRLPPRRR